MDSFFWTNGGQPQPATFECDVRRTTRLATNPTDTKGSIIAIGLSGGMVSLSSLPKVVDGPATTGGAASLVVDDLLPGVAPAERRLLLDDDAFVVGGKRAVRAIATATATWRTGSAATAAAPAHSVAICQDGTAYSWGTGGNGRLGLGHTDTFAAPAPIKFGRDCRGAALVIADVRCGDAHTVATTDDGALYAWGEGFSGQTGHGAKRPTLVPRFVAALNAERAVSVACGSRFTIIATANGEVWTWGEGTCGQLGVARPRDVLLYFLQKHSPAMVDDAERILAEYAGREKKMWSGLEATYGEHPCTLYGASASASTKGSVKASARPVRALNATHRDAPFTSVAAGFAHALAMGGADGATLYSWGLNSRGQLGLGDFTARRLPTRVEHERTAPSFLDRIEVPAHCSRVAAAANYSAALFEGDELHTWGSGTAPLGHAAAAPSEAGSKPPPSVTRPRRVEMLRGIPVVMMHCLPDAMACVVVPAITELVPDAGNMHGGTRLQICGGGFFDSAEVEAVVNGTRGEEQSLLVRFAFPSVALAKKDADQGDESEGNRPASSGGAESAMQIAASEVIVNAVLMKNGRIACDVPALPEEIVEAVAGDVLSEIAAARAMLATVDVSCDGGASWTAERDACTTTGTHHFRYIGDQILKGVTPKTAIAAGGTVLTLNSVGFAAPPPELLEQDELIDEDGAMTPNAMVMQRKHEQSATRHAVATHSEGATVHFTSASGEVFHEPLRTVHTDTGATEVCVTCPGECNACRLSSLEKSVCVCVCVWWTNVVCAGSSSHRPPPPFSSFLIPTPPSSTHTQSYPLRVQRVSGTMSPLRQTEQTLARPSESTYVQASSMRSNLQCLMLTSALR